MKKIILILLIFVISIFSKTGIKKVKAEENLVLNGTKALVMEVTSGKILYSLNENEKAYPASMTKMMGMYLVLESIEEDKIEWTTMVTCSKYASSMGGTQLYLEEGERMSVDELFKAVAINSCNDAIVCLGEHLYGSNELFVDKMNEKAKELKMSNTHFNNATGFDDENHYTTTFDMGIIARRLILDYPLVLNYSCLKEDYIKGERNEEFWLVNTNKLLNHCDGMDGLKTGFTGKAGYNLASTVKRNGIRIITVVMNEKSIEDRSQDTIKLVNYGFAKLKIDRLYEKNTEIGTYIFPKSEGKEIKLYLKNNVDIVSLKDEDVSNYTYSIIVNKTDLPLKKGDQVGYLEVVDKSNNKFQFEIVILENVDKINLFKLWINNIKKILY